MIESNPRAWRLYISENMEAVQTDYQYPTDESVTDNFENYQDPMKRYRELEAISNTIPSDAKVIFDFGCGVGRNFEEIRKAVLDSEDALFIGIEPDERRADISAGNKLDFEVFHEDIRIIEQAPQNNKIDYFLCCQVLGHTPVNVTNRICTAAIMRLSDTGVAHFCIPFVNSSLADAKGDFFHMIDLEKNPEDKGFRVRISAEEFDRLTSSRNTSGILPVRAFSVLIPERNMKQNIYFPLVNLPYYFQTFAIEPFYVEATIYSIHAWYDDVPYVGDISVAVRRGT